MTLLPVALSRWREQLRILPDDLAAELGRLILRLAPAFDNLSSSRHDPAGDIDGFDGIANRGSYERLLASEWGLSRAAPLEFLRRATAGEQAFLRLLRRTPAEPERTLALFDAGPDQLGGCRIVQLALLVLLVERCRSQGRELWWQLLHHQGETLRSGLDEISVRTFLQGRTGLRASTATVTSWLGGHAGARIWLIGGRAATHYGKAAFARLTLQERVALEAPAVDVVLDAGLERRVTLLLPPSDQCVRLLRDPFDQAKARRTTAPAIDGGVLLSASGARLFYCTRDGSLVSTPVPNSPRAPVGKPRLYAAEGAGYAICCVGGRGRRAVWLSHANGQLRVGHATDAPHKRVLTAPGPQPAKASPLAWFGEEMGYYATPERSLWRVDFRTQRSRCIAEGVRAWLQTGVHDIVAVDRFLDGTDHVPHLLELLPYTATPLPRRDWAWQEVRLSSAKNGRLTLAACNDGAWLIEEWLRTPDGWRVNSNSTLHQPAGTRVLGIEVHTLQQRLPGLWLLEPSRQEISIARRSSTRDVLETEATIEHTHLATNGSVLALRTSTDELLVVSATGKILYRGSTAA